MLRVGLTGGIGSGKSTVARLLAERGAVVVDSDELAREVVRPGSPGLAAVVAEFGPGVLDAGGGLDRAELARVVFGDEAARLRLNAVVHPLVAAAAATRVAAADPAAVVVQDVPLLVELGLHGGFDAVVVVEAPLEQRLDRLVRLRGMAEADARARIGAQASDEERRAVATYVIVNDGDLAALAGEVERLWATLTALTGRAKDTVD